MAVSKRRHGVRKPNRSDREAVNKHTEPDVKIRMLVWQKGVVQASMPNEKFARFLTRLDESNVQLSETEEQFYRAMASMVTDIVDIEEAPPVIRGEFAFAMWRRVLRHPKCGPEVVKELRRRLEKQQSSRITWWIEDMDHPDFVFVGDSFHETPPFRGLAEHEGTHH